VAALDAPDHALNVAFDARANPLRQNDVAYTSKVLSEVDRIICLDARRIFCAGFSRGARFCSRLASERSDIFAAVATMSGLRFPRPNNATRPVPILAFHGTGDKINPFEGGGPKYWMTSVPDAVSAWVNFNGCKEGSKQSVAPNQVMHMYSACWDHAHVVLMEVKGGGHEWPDSSYKLSAYSPEAPRANELIMHFSMRTLYPSLELQLIVLVPGIHYLPIICSSRRLLNKQQVPHKLRRMLDLA